MSWTPVALAETLVTKSRILFKHKEKQIVVLRHNGTLRAFDNRCPHQGFPLQVGTLAEGDDCVLTCNWHNWKFDLKDGSCLTGGDRVRVYPCKEAPASAKDPSPTLFVDLSDPTPEAIQEAVLKDLKQAFDERQYGRIYRELSRLAFQGLDPTVALRSALLWHHDRLEYGMRHGIAVSADWLRLYKEKEGNLEDQLIALAEAIDHLSFESLRLPAYPYESASKPWNAEEFLAAIENEDEPTAISLIRGATAEGATAESLSPVLSEAALAHYNSGGHSIIYVQKVVELEQQLGAEVGQALLLPLVRHILFATREDLLPEFKAYGKALTEFPPSFGSQSEALSGSSLSGLGVTKALAWAAQHAATHTPMAVFDGLYQVLAANMRDFDASYQAAFDRPTKEHIGWLDFTHALTMANAVRIACTQTPKLWPAGILQLACYSGRNQSFLDPAQGENIPTDNPDMLDATMFETVTDHGLGLPIYSAHLVKTWIATREDRPHLSPAAQAAGLQAIRRLLGAQLKQKHVRRQAREAIELVARDFPEAAARFQV